MSANLSCFTPTYRTVRKSIHIFNYNFNLVFNVNITECLHIEVYFPKYEYIVKEIKQKLLAVLPPLYPSSVDISCGKDE